jgi:PEP-CTERM motif
LHNPRSSCIGFGEKNTMVFRQAIMGGAFGAMTLIAAGGQANAVLTVQLSTDAFTTYTEFTDTDGNGILTVEPDTSLGYGGWEQFTVTGRSNIATGDPGVLQNTNIAANVRSGTPGTVWVRVFDDEFMAPDVDLFDATTRYNATALQGASLDLLSEVAGQTVLEADAVIGTMLPIAFAQISDAGIPFTIMHQFVLNPIGANADVAFDMTTRTSIPEPAALAMLGIGMVGIGAVMRRRRVG